MERAVIKLKPVKNLPPLFILLILVIGSLGFAVKFSDPGKPASVFSSLFTENDSAGSPTAVILPLKKGPAGSRYLTGQNNRPFFWSGDAAWSLIAQADRKEVLKYLDNRKEKGFSVIMVNLIEHKFSKNAPSNFYGDKPFTGKPFTTPNEKYFTYADFVIREAQRRGMVVLLAPLYLGYDCGDEGWCQEVKAATKKDLLELGKICRIPLPGQR